MPPCDRSVFPGSPPLAVVAKIKNALSLLAIDEAAERLGLVKRHALADARAMIPALGVADDDPVADGALLEAIADWAERYTPLVALDPPDGLMLDITGCAHLFGGEAELLADLATRLRSQGFFVRVAVADTPGAASAAARFAAIPGVIPPGGAAAMLAALPLAALRLDRETVSALDRVGLKKIGQVIGGAACSGKVGTTFPTRTCSDQKSGSEIPFRSRAPLVARFGRDFIRRLDQALGLEEEAINPRRPAPALIAERRFAEPIVRQEDIAAVLSSLATTLAKGLEAQGLGARHLELSLFRVDGVVKRIAVGAGRPIRSPKLVLDLFREKFAGLGEDIDMGFGFDMARLAVAAAAPADAAQIDLSGAAAAEADLDGLIDRIGARLGRQRVVRIESHPSHIPEQAEIHTWQPAGHTADSRPQWAEKDPIDRPLRLLARPEPVEAIAEVPDGPPVRFRWRRVLYQVARAEGPERISPEWWHDDGLTRDYFRVEDQAGYRFWLYREGLYGRELTAPRWYLHGVFA
ncbi:MAG: DNA polymerase Y family protein [Bauldia sp.]